VRQRLTAGEHVLANDLTTRGPDGSPLELVVSAVPIAGGGYGPDHVLIVVADMTEARRLQQQVEQNQRLDALGRMAGAVAHDYNNLLTVILGYTEIVLNRLADDDPSKADLQSVYQASEQARALADQLLTLSRRSVVRPEVVDPAIAVATLGEVVRRLAGAAVTTEIVADPAVGCVLIDPGQLNQIVLNLVMNAVDAMPDGGRLGIRVAKEQDAEGDGFVVLEVSDTGTGMSDGFAERCLEPFFTTKRRSGGTGLGLATVHAIVSQAGGDISLESTAGRGTTFTVRLPRVDGRRAMPDATDAGPVSGEGTVLLVEDEDAVRAYASAVLRTAGFSVAEAASGKEALAEIEQHGGSFDIVVTDVVMPGMTGVELARRIDELLPSLPVLLVSGFAEDPRLHGPNGVQLPFLSKPYRPDVLLHAVRVAMHPEVGAPN
jgi:signal transduction histidine kinase/CheY-like chemotaxis protein